MLLTLVAPTILACTTAGAVWLDLFQGHFHFQIHSCCQGMKWDTEGPHSYFLDGLGMLSYLYVLQKEKVGRNNVVLNPVETGLLFFATGSCFRPLFLWTEEGKITEMF